MATNSSTSSLNPLINEQVISAAVDFLLHDTGDRIVKSEESLTHLENLETAADSGGFSAANFSLLCRIAATKRMPPRLSHRFFSLLVPSEPVPGEDIRDLALSALGDQSRNILNGVLPALRVVELCLEHNLVMERRLLSHIYELFLAALAKRDLVGVVAGILLSITNKTEVNERRVGLVRKANDEIGVSYELNTLRWLFRQLRPDLEPNCPRPPAHRPARNSVLYKRFRKVTVADLDPVVKQGLGWEAGQLAGSVEFREAQRQLALPTAETINLLPGLESRRNAARRAISSLCSLKELRDHMETVLLPNNILALLGLRGSVNILARKEVVERFSLNLYHTLKKELVYAPSRMGGREAAVRARRQEKLLGHANRLQEQTFQALPVIGRFLAEYLVDWNGQDHFRYVLELTRFLQITDFKELYDTILSPIEAHFDSYSLVNQLLVFINFNALFRFWGSLEYRRFTQTKSGLFPDNTFNCGNAFAAVQALGHYMGELVLKMLANTRENHDYSSDCKQYLLPHIVIRAFKLSQELLVEYKVPLRLEIPVSLVHEAIFSHSVLPLVQVCEYLVYQKKVVLPLLRQSALSSETLGDETMTDLVRSQISSKSLESIETVTKEVLLILSPANFLPTPGSLINRGWRVPEELQDSGLFVSQHPAFLPYILHYLDSLRLSEAERQTFWRGLSADRSEELQLEEVQYGDDAERSQRSRIPPHQFYRTSGSAAAGGGKNCVSEDVEMFHKYLGELLPTVTDFLAAFQPRSSRPAPSVGSQETESSGVSSLFPKQKTRSGKSAQQQRGSSRENRPENPKRSPFAEPEPPRQSKKRQTLKERN